MGQNTAANVSPNGSSGKLRSNAGGGAANGMPRNRVCHGSAPLTHACVAWK